MGAYVQQYEVVSEFQKLTFRNAPV